jgi:O-acetyl-ADP-ribose deacetylase (regulator of RNase III)
MKKIKIGDAQLELIVGDITKQDTEAIVNAANNRLAPGGGVAGAIHRAAGPQLWEECRKLNGCVTGEAKITKGYNLPALYIIHTVGPVYSGSSKDAKLLASSYRDSIRLANDKKIRSVSFPSLSTGYFGYPMEEAAKIAIKTVIDELKTNLEINLIRFVLYDSKSYEIYEETLDSI